MKRYLSFRYNSLKKENDDMKMFTSVYSILYGVLFSLLLLLFYMD